MKKLISLVLPVFLPAGLLKNKLSVFDVFSFDSAQRTVRALSGSVLSEAEAVEASLLLFGC
jgi:hypothetical protein